MQRHLGSCPEGALLWRSVSLGISEVGSVGGEQNFIYMEISQGLEIRGNRQEVTDCSLFTANQVLECLWSAKWGHGGREWQSHSLKLLLRLGGGLQTKPGNVKGNGSLKIILCNPFILALFNKQLWGQQRPGLVTARMWQQAKQKASAWNIMVQKSNEKSARLPSRSAVVENGMSRFASKRVGG